MMPWPTGFPSKEDARKDLQTIVYQNHHDLRELAGDAMDQLAAVAQSNDIDQKKIQRQVNTKLAGIMSANSKDCAQMADLVTQMQAGYAPPENISLASQTMVPPGGHSSAGNCQVFPPYAAPPGSIWWTIIDIGATPCPVFGTLASTPDCNADDIRAARDVNPSWPILGGFTSEAYAMAAGTAYVDANYPNCGGKGPPPPPPPPLPPPPIPTCPGGAAPDPVTGECPPPPPPPPPTPPPGDCNNPIHVVICPPDIKSEAGPIDQCPAQGDGEIPPLPEEPPPETPPEQPPYSVPVIPPDQQPMLQQMVAAGINVQGEDGPVISLCKRLSDASDSIVQLGNELVQMSCDGVDGWTIGIKAFSRLAYITDDAVIHMPPQYFTGLEKAFRSISIGGIARNIETADAMAFQYDRVRARNIYIVKAYLEALRDMTSAVTMDGSSAGGAHYSLGAEAFGLGGAVTGDTKAGTTASTHIAIKCVCIPSIALCEVLLKWQTTTEIPKTADAIQAWIKGELSVAERDCLLMMNGVNPSLWGPVIYAQRERMSVDEIIEWSRRNNRTFEQTLQDVKDLGWVDEGEAKARMFLYDELPTPQDFLHYLQRNVFDTQYVEDYGLLDGFDQRYWANFGVQLSAIGVSYERAQLDYAAHWNRPAPGELREFHYRTNPDYYNGNNPTTVDDYRRTLAEQDYTPWDVKRYVETLYRVPALGYLRDMYRSFLLSDEQMKVYHQKLGYSGEDSDHFVEIDKLVRARIRASESHGWTPAALASAFSVGVLQDSDVVTHMSEMGYSSDEAQTLMVRARAELQRTVITRARSRTIFAVLTQVKSALSAGIVDATQAISAITQLGWPVEFAQGWVQITTSALQVKLVNQTVNRIRSAFLSGEIDASYALDSLTTLGVVPTFRDQTLIAWQLQMTPNRKRRSAQQIVSDLSYGMMDTSEALIRLTNLGYDEPDRLLYLADAQRKIVQREAKEAAAQQKTARQQAQDLRRLEADARSQANRLRGVLQRVASRPTLMTWAKHGVISFDEFSQSMKDLNYDDDNIQRYWLDACSTKTAKCLPASAPSESPPASPDGSVYTPDELGGIMP